MGSPYLSNDNRLPVEVQSLNHLDKKAAPCVEYNTLFYRNIVLMNYDVLGHFPDFVGSPEEGYRMSSYMWCEYCDQQGYIMHSLVSPVKPTLENTDYVKEVSYLEEIGYADMDAPEKVPQHLKQEYNYNLRQMPILEQQCHNIPPRTEKRNFDYYKLSEDPLLEINPDGTTEYHDTDGHYQIWEKREFLMDPEEGIFKDVLYDRDVVTHMEYWDYLRYGGIPDPGSEWVLPKKKSEPEPEPEPQRPAPKPETKPKKKEDPFELDPRLLDPDLLERLRDRN